MHSLSFHPTFDLFLESIHETPRAIDIVVPVYNSIDTLRVCIKDLLSSLGPHDRVIVLDDASSDPEVGSFLEALSDARLIKHSNAENLGYTKTVNLGISFRREGADVIVLNSDTHGFKKGWHRKLQAASLSGPRIGTVTPWGTGIEPFGFRTKEINDISRISGSSDLSEVAIEKHLPTSLIEVPTGHGFCMLITANLLETVPEFDVESFPRGYGEENDYCQRALKLGFRNVLFTKVFVQHVGTSSFAPEEKRQRLREGIHNLRRMHPTYEYQVLDLLQSGDLEAVSKSFLTEYTSSKSPFKPRFLIVNAVEEGGTRDFSELLANRLSNFYEVLIMVASPSSVRVEGWGESEFLWEQPMPITQNALSQISFEFDRIFAEFLIASAVERVHFDHVSWISRNASKVTRALGIESMFYIHDYFLICPTVQLLDQANVFCGGDCLKSNALDDCEPSLQNSNFVGPLRGKPQSTWITGSASFLEAVDHIVAPSYSAKKIFTKNFGDEIEILVLEHPISKSGSETIRALNHPGAQPTSSKESKYFDILVLGNIGRHKGSETFMGLLKHSEENSEEKVRLIFAGRQNFIVNPPHKNLGPYSGEQLAEIVRKSRPRLALFLSNWDETYNFAADDAALAGLPVVCTPMGAPNERFSGEPFFLSLSDQVSNDPALLIRTLKHFGDRNYSNAIEAWKSKRIKSDSAWLDEYLNLWR